MGTKKRDKGYVISYENVPADVLNKILDKQTAMKKTKGHSKLSMGAAITALIRAIK